MSRDPTPSSPPAGGDGPDPPPDLPPAAAPAAGPAAEVFRAFLRLGLTSFGGPVAHLAYFREAFVQRRRWLDDARYGELVALCQFLPGPTSSQVGFAIGLARAGWRGGLAAWLGFTLPSALILMLCAGALAPRLDEPVWSAGVHGLKLAALAVVAQAVWSMSRTLCPDRPRGGIAVLAALLALAVPGVWGQLAALAAGALAGLRLVPARPAPHAAPGRWPIGRRGGALLLALHAMLLALLPVLAALGPSALLQAAAVVYRAGALVFGGGHLMLPLLQAPLVAPGWIGEASFLAGYGATQAMPGPLFSFAAYLGVAMPAPLGGWATGLLLLAAIYLPSGLIVAGVLPFWESLRRQQRAQRALGGLNAAVVGLLAAALYDPMWIHTVGSRADFALVLGAFGLLVIGRVSPVGVVLLSAGCAWALAA